MNTSTNILHLDDVQFCRIIKGYVDFDKIIYSSPNVLREPSEIKSRLMQELSLIGIKSYHNTDIKFESSFRLECKNGLYYLLCYAVRNENNEFILLVGGLYKVRENLDPFSEDTDIPLTSEQVKLDNESYISKILNN